MISVAEIEDIISEASRFASEQLEKGEASSIVQSLVERGLDKETAQGIYAKSVVARREKQERRDSGELHMKIGGFVAGLGCLILAATYILAPEGGMYVIPWGAMAFGSIWFTIGLSQYTGW